MKIGQVYSLPELGEVVFLGYDRKVEYEVFRKVESGEQVARLIPPIEREVEEPAPTLAPKAKAKKEQAEEAAEEAAPEDDA